MASEEQVAAGSPPSASVVGNAFVHQYYNILYQSPGLVYRFYQENSRLGRPEAHGLMCSITTMQAIKEKILSMDYGGVRAEIKTIDAQESLSGGVIVLVTGYLIGKDNVRRNFTQSFFLATQDKGYFVLNDIFRYIEEDNYLHGNQGLPNGNNVPLSEQEVPPASEENVPDQSEEAPEEDEVIEEVYNPSDHEEGSVLKDETPNYEVIDKGQNIAETKAVESVYSGSQAEAPKKSYASIVKVKKENVAPSPVKAPAPIKAVPPIEEHAAPAPTPLPASENPVAPSSMSETSSTQETEVDGHSIYVKSLPLSATSAELEEEFKRFGPIKPGRVQVRSHRQQGFCFGFIEFEAAGSVQSAIKASPVMIGGRQAFVEEKRPTGSRAAAVGPRGRIARALRWRSTMMRRWRSVPLWTNSVLHNLVAHPPGHCWRDLLYFVVLV